MGGRGITPVPALVLASASPRRRALLARLGIEFDIVPVDLDESLSEDMKPEIIAMKHARSKAEAWRLLDEERAVLAADTVVSLGGRALGKPADAREARAMLEALRGGPHSVVTTVALMPAGKTAALARHLVTNVWMREYSDSEIEASILRGDPFDKAGAYGIQDEVLRPVARYDGCYCNVVGLPLWAAIDLLRRGGFALQIGPADLLPQCSTCPLRPPE